MCGNMVSRYLFIDPSGGCFYTSPPLKRPHAILPPDLAAALRRVLLVQALLTLLVVAGFGVRGGWREALAAGYGGAVTILVSGWLGWRLRRIGERTQAVANLGLLYSSAALRYAAAIVLLALGLGLLGLSPLPLVVAFGLAQFGFLVSAGRR